MKKNIILAFLAFSLLSCDKDIVQDNPKHNNSVTNVVAVESNISINISTDKAYYKPGDIVKFTADKSIVNAMVRYRHLSTVISETNVTGTSWSWTTPTTDYTGYIVDIYQKQGDNSELILGTIGVDVSSDWKKFPRYGFVASFEPEKNESDIQKEIEYLNRHHINGVQFQDWHNKHHYPLGGTRTELDATYKDIANRTVSTAVIKNYIKVQHSYGMKSMFYNLCFGALADAATDGVKEEWYLFKDASHTSKDSHELPSSWKSNIYLLDPTNKEWQAYIAQRNDDVYANFDFDGYQIDQLGNRGTRYNKNGKSVNLPKGYSSFINAMKSAHPSKDLVMNAVSSYGAKEIAQSGNIDFLYNEVWGDEAEYNNLYSIIKANKTYSNGELNTVFAAYMNYDKANDKGEFNTPGVLLTDAVMFALGGSHLELGGTHMLCKEYFPNNNLSMSKTLRESLVCYYDFMTAYENILRDGGDDNPLVITSPSVKVNAWGPKKGNVTTYSKSYKDKQIINFLNFTQVDNLSWRDLNGDMPEPKQLNSIPMNIMYNKKISKIWVASPDSHGGASQELAFKQVNGLISLLLPSLKYWTVLVIE